MNGMRYRKISGDIVLECGHSSSGGLKGWQWRRVGVGGGGGVGIEEIVLLKSETSIAGVNARQNCVSTFGSSY